MELLEPAPPDVAGPSADQLPEDRRREAAPRAADERRQFPLRSRCIDLGEDSSSPRRARLFVDEASRDWGCSVVRDDAVLVASELVGNAVGHARTPCRLDIRLDALGLTIAVRDYTTPGPLVPLAFGATGHRDHGLFLVASICRAWGVSPTENGKIVWALLPVASADRRTAPG